MSRRLFLLLPPFLGLLVAAPAPRGPMLSPAPSPVSGDCAAITAATADDCLRLNHLQVLGTHNSYHLAPEPPILAFLGDRAPAYDYTHRPLTEQLSELGVRQFEIDVYADPVG